MTFPDADILQQYLNTGDYASAESTARQILSGDANHVPAQETLATVLAMQKRWPELEDLLPKLEALAPKSIAAVTARAYLKMGRQAFKEAESAFRQLLELHPSHPTVRHDLAASLAKQNRLPEAIALFEEAAKYHHRPHDCWRNLAVALRRMGRFEEAQAMIDRALAVEPDNIAFLAVRCDLLVDMADMDQAKVLLDRCMKSNPTMVRSTLSRWHLLQGDLPNGFREFANYLQANLHLFRQDVAGALWSGQSLKEKTILLYEEQGFGDTIQFIRYAEMLSARGATVFVEIRAALKQLVSRVKGVNWTYTHGQPRPEYDYRLPIIQLPRAMGSTLKNIPAKVPYMQPPTRLVDYWKDRTAGDRGRLRVGLCWYGRPEHDEDFRRSMPTEDLLPLAELSDVSFYSLQRQTPQSELDKIAGPLRLIDHTSKLNDFADTAALMANLDLVISVDTSIAHLAGATARPVWTLLNRAGEWRWLLKREDTPWYPTMRLFRQADARGWGSLMRRVLDELRQFKGAR